MFYQSIKFNCEKKNAKWKFQENNTVPPLCQNKYISDSIFRLWIWFKLVNILDFMIGMVCHSFLMFLERYSMTLYEVILSKKSSISNFYVTPISCGTITKIYNFLSNYLVEVKIIFVIETHISMKIGKHFLYNSYLFLNFIKT